jgi:hypothetical protein
VPSLEIVKRSLYWRAQLLSCVAAGLPNPLLRREFGEPRTFDDRTVTDGVGSRESEI